MTISTETSRMTYSGNGTTVAFPYSFKIFDEDDLTVTQRDADTGVETTLTIDTHYSVSGVGVAAGGTVTLVTAPPTGDVLTIRRVMDFTQTTSIQNSSTMFRSTLESALDRLVMMIQQLQDSLARAFQLPETFDPADYDTTLPAPTVGQVVVWSATGPTFSTLADSDNVALPGDSRVVATLTTYLSNNADINFLDYIPDAELGTVMDGTDEASGYLQAAENVRQSVGGILRIPRGTYKITTPVISDTAQTHWRIDAGTTFLCYATADACLKFIANGLAQGQYHRIKIEGLMRIKNMVAAHRTPMLTLGDASALDVVDIDNLELDGNFLERDGMLLDRAWEGSLRMVTLENFQRDGVGMGVGCVWKATTLNAGNLHFDTWQTTTCPIIFLLNESPGPGNVINSVHFNNCKQARGLFVDANKFYAGTVAAGGASLGASVINLTAGQGALSAAAAGDWITICHGTSDLVVMKVASVDTDELTLVTDGAHADGLPFALSAGDPVIFGNWHTILGPSVKSAHFTVPHFERGNGVLGWYANTVTIDKPCVSADVYRVAYLAGGCQGWEVKQPLNFVAYPSGAVILHVANEALNGRNRVVGPIKVTGTLPTILQNDGGNQSAFVMRGGGVEHMLGSWVQLTTVAASQTAVQMTSQVTGVATYGVRTRSKGCLVALNVQSRVARSAGTLTATVYKNGSATTMTAVLDGTNTFNKLTEYFDESQFVLFVPGDLLDVRVTTDASWAPTATDIVATLHVCQ